MRDSLTALAGAVILILVAALAAPPFIDWAGQRALIDRTISDSLGLAARSEGRIEVRLLPSPRLRFDRLSLGGQEGDQSGRPSLDARFVKAEVALAPLLKGEFRFTETRIGRAELLLPVAEGDAILLPGNFAETIGARDLVIEDLLIEQALVTTRVSATGRTEQYFAEDLRLKAPSLNGPWQAEGASGGVPFRLATGAIGADGTLVKITGGGEGKPRFEADARITLKPLAPSTDTQTAADAPRVLVPEAEGSARLVVGQMAVAGQPNQAASFMPFTLGGRFKARGGLVRFDSVSAEIDPGGQSARLTGSGQIDLRQWRAGLTLEARRLNLDGLIFSSRGQALLRGGTVPGAALLPVMLDLDLTLESLALGFEDWSDLRFKGTFDRTGGLVLRRFSASAPGAAKLESSGEIEVAPSLRFNGHVAIDAARTDGLGRYLGRLGFVGPTVAALDGRSLRTASDLTASPGEVSLRNLRLDLGEARLGGNARYRRAEAGSRGRFDAQLTAEALDLAQLPSLGDVLPSLDQHDVGLTIEARDVRYGPAGAGGGKGRITARIESDGPSLVVDRLDIANLSGTNATLSGRIAPDGGGRITGRVSAPSAAPLLSLVDRTWIAEARLLPRFLREGALDLEVTLEREAGATGSLRTSAKGKAGESSIEGSVLARSGRLDSLDATLASPRSGRWFGRDDIAGLRQPGSLKLTARRAPAQPDGAAPLNVEASGTIAGLAVSTPQPIVIGADANPPDSGTLRIASADLGPFLTLAGAAGSLPGPIQGEATIALSRKATDAHAEISGKIDAVDASASLDRKPDGALAGRITLGKLSLPALAGALVVPTDPRSGASDAAGWWNARFAGVPVQPRADLTLNVGQLDLGRGMLARDARFGLTLDGEALTLKGLTGSFAGGQLTGSATLARQGSNATLSGEGSLQDATIKELAGESAIGGRISTSLRYSGTGDSASTLMANLGGSGEITLADLVVPGADPAALDRGLARALDDEDPLREGRLAAILSEEFGAAAFSAKGPVSTSAALIGGSLRSSPFELDLASSRWSGSFTLDLRQRRLDARGTLSARNAPKGWSGGKPSVQLGFSGPLSAPQRVLDVGPVSNGLAALVLQRELEKIELFEADQSERQRRRARIDMDRARVAAIKAAAEKAAAEKAAAEKAAAEEAARAARLRAQQAADEAARQARERLKAEERLRAEDAARRARIEAERNAAPAEAPLDIRPPQP